MSVLRKPPSWAEFLASRISGFFVGIVLAWILLGFVAPLWITDKDMPSAGQLGDMFGMVNSLFSGLAFLAAITAVLLQTVELEESRKQETEQGELQKHQLQIGVTTVRIQAQMQEAELTRGIVSCLCKTNRDVTSYLIAHTQDAYAGLIDIGLDSGSRQSTSNGKQQFEHRRFLAMIDLQDDHLAVQLCLGKDAEELKAAIDELLESGGRYFSRDGGTDDMTAAANHVRAQIKEYWEGFSKRISE
jgi:hypothetical protein